jgi:hypothetical protein
MMEFSGLSKKNLKKVYGKKADRDGGGSETLRMRTLWKST